MREAIAPALTDGHLEQDPNGAGAVGKTAGRATGRFRLAHLALLGEGLVIGVLGGVALAWSMANQRFDRVGIPIIGLTVTPLHGALLLGAGALTILACLGRWVTVVFSTVAACGWTALTVVCAIEVAHHAPGLLGFDPRDTRLYGALGAYNIVLAIWLARVAVAAPDPPRRGVIRAAGR